MYSLQFQRATDRQIEAKDKNKLGVLEGAIQQELRDMGQARLAAKFVLTSNFLNDILSLYWAMPTSDSLDMGSMANPFMLGDTNMWRISRC